MPEPVATYSIRSSNARVGIELGGAEASRAMCQARLGTGKGSRHGWRQHGYKLSPSLQARKKAVGRQVGCGGRGDLGMRLPEGEMVSLAWAVGLQIFGWCTSTGEGGCTLERGTLNPTAEWLDVSPGSN